MTTLLLSAAELSNIFSVLAVLLCFCAMILFIARNMMVLRGVHGEDFVFNASALHQVPPRIPQMNMMKVHIPFTFKLLETSKSSYSELQCSVSSQVKYCVHAYWGVNIRELHIFLWRPWADVKNACLRGDFLKGYYQYPGLQVQKTAHSDETITLKLPAPSLDLGTPPRLCYPLVIFLFRTDKEDDLHPDETVALINVVHIKDSVCTLPTSILAQYLKQANGQLSCLKQLYLATGNPGGYEEGQIPLAVAEPVEGGPGTLGRTLVCGNEDSALWNSSGEQLCVVCQFFPLSRALLPCRHTCICASCFDKLDRCPMCRGPIKSYFCIRGEEYMPIQSNGKSQSASATNHSSFYNWLFNWDDRLTDFLGFQR